MSIQEKPLNLFWILTQKKDVNGLVLMHVHQTQLWSTLAVRMEWRVMSRVLLVTAVNGHKIGIYL